MKYVACSVGAALAVVLVVNAQENGAKRTIKEVMKAAHGGGKNSLLNQVVGGAASATQKKELLHLYEDLIKNTPKKGSADSWKQKAGAVVRATQAVVNGEEGAARKLQGVTTCAGCHGAHK